METNHANVILLNTNPEDIDIAVLSTERQLEITQLAMAMHADALEQAASSQADVPIAAAFVSRRVLAQEVVNLQGIQRSKQQHQLRTVAGRLVLSHR